MSSKTDKNLEKFFEVPASENINNFEISKQVIERESFEKDLNDDYQIVRENFHELIEKGKDAVDDILAIAKESERSRDFEVAATLLKNVLDANEQMINLHKKIREITNYKQESSDKTTINNALFVGSTTELSKLVKELNQKDIKDIN